MVNETGQKYTLAIESAIGGGSISLQSAEGIEVDALTGNNSVSRAEDLLPNIFAMLEHHSLSRQMIDRVAVSLGPGSYTGIRVGIATALGLKDSLNIPCIGVSALEALALAFSVGRSLVAVPMGRQTICWQVFDQRALAVTEPAVSKAIDPEMIERSGASEIIVHGSLLVAVQDMLPGRTILDAGLNVAQAIGTASFGKDLQTSLEPIFVAAA